MYVNAFIEDDEVVIIERIEGERIIRREPVDWTFFVKDRHGNHESIYGDTLKKIEPEDKREYYFLKKQFSGGNELFESDVNRVHQYLSNNYGEDDIPELRVGFIDIEVGYTPENKYSNPDDTENEIISVSITDRDSGNTEFLVIPPLP